jgi:hypothetical protein
MNFIRGDRRSGTCVLPMGGVRKDAHGGTYFWIQRQIRSYKNLYSPQLRAKPIHIPIIVYIMEQAYRTGGTDDERAVVAMIIITVNTSGKAGAQLPHLPLGDDSSPWGR